MPNPVSFDLVRSCEFSRMLDGLMSLWTRPRWCSLPSSHGDADSQAQEALDLHRRGEQPVERLEAADILEHQHGTTAISHDLQRPHRPRSVQLFLQSVFVGEAIEA